MPALLQIYRTAILRRLPSSVAIGLQMVYDDAQRKRGHPYSSSMVSALRKLESSLTDDKSSIVSEQHDLQTLSSYSSLFDDDVSVAQQQPSMRSRTGLDSASTLTSASTRASKFMDLFLAFEGNTCPPPRF